MLFRSVYSFHLIDWEGLTLAPKEADLFAFKYQPYYHQFLESYKQYFDDLHIHEDAMNFYCLKRVLNDLWEHIEILHYDHVNQELYNKNMSWMKKVICQLQ